MRMAQAGRCVVKWKFAGMVLIRHMVVVGLVLMKAGMAGDTASLHVANVNFDFRPGWTLQVHTRVRTFENVSTFNQFRIGPIVTWQATPRFLAITGYYYIDQNVQVIHKPYSLHRVFSGGQYRVVSRARWSVDGRSAMERFISTGFHDYWRWRNRALVSGNTRLEAPYVSGEALVQQGIWYGRYTAGMQWKLGPKVMVGAGYEYRPAPNGPPSHIIATIVQWSAYTRRPAHKD